MFDRRLHDDAKKVLAVLTPHLPNGTYLAGGSALAMHIDHRDSFDLDLYSPEAFDVPKLVKSTKQLFPDHQALDSQWQTIHFITNNTEVSLFVYPYALLEEPREYQGIKIASLKDIAAMKLEAIGGRGLKRDFFDVYTICQKLNWSLEFLIELNLRKYDHDKNMTLHLLKALTFFDDAEQKEERAKIVDSDWQTVKLFFATEVPKAIPSILEK